MSESPANIEVPKNKDFQNSVSNPLSSQDFNSFSLRPYEPDIPQVNTISFQQPENQQGQTLNPEPQVISNQTHPDHQMYEYQQMHIDNSNPASLYLNIPSSQHIQQAPPNIPMVWATQQNTERWDVRNSIPQPRQVEWQELVSGVPFPVARAAVWERQEWALKNLGTHDPGRPCTCSAFPTPHLRLVVRFACPLVGCRVRFRIAGCLPTNAPRLSKDLVNCSAEMSGGEHWGGLEAHAHLPVRSADSPLERALIEEALIANPRIRPKRLAQSLGVSLDAVRRVKDVLRKLRASAAANPDGSGNVRRKPRAPVRRRRGTDGQDTPPPAVSQDTGTAHQDLPEASPTKYDPDPQQPQRDGEGDHPGHATHSETTKDTADLQHQAQAPGGGACATGGDTQPQADAPTRTQPNRRRKKLSVAAALALYANSRQQAEGGDQGGATGAPCPSLFFSGIPVGHFPGYAQSAPDNVTAVYPQFRPYLPHVGLVPQMGLGGVDQAPHDPARVASGCEGQQSQNPTHNQSVYEGPPSKVPALPAGGTDGAAPQYPPCVPAAQTPSAPPPLNDSWRPDAGTAPT